MKNQAALKAALLYTTNRDKFDAIYSKDKNSALIKLLLEEVFLKSESRPDLAERVALYSFGAKLREGKKGYDGYTKDGRPIEAKVRNLVSVDGKFSKGVTSNTINDVSEIIVDRYRKDNPLFFFPYFYDGHYAVAFTVEYTHLAPYYEACLKKCIKGRVSFKLSATSWLPHAHQVHLHQSKMVRQWMPPIYKKFLKIN